MRFVLALLLIAATPRQDVQLGDVLDLLEKHAEGLRDLSFKIRNRGGRNWGLPNADVSVLFVRGTGLRVRARADSLAEGAGMLGMAAPSAADFIYTSDRFRLIQEWEHRATGDPIAFYAASIRNDDPALKSHDHFFLPSTGYPIRLMYDEPLLYFQIAPKMFFGLEPNLVYEGARSEGGKSCHVLASSYVPRDPKLPQSGILFETRRREFLIERSSGAIRRIRWDIAIRYPMVQRGEQRMTFVLEPAGEQKVTETLTVPESVRWGQILEGQNLGRTQVLIREIAAIRANAGLAASEILSDAEKNDLYGDAVVRSSEEYEARTKRDSKDAEAQYALALSRGFVDPMARMFRVGGGGAGKPEAAPVIAALEQAAQLRPEAEGPGINLLAAYAAASDTKGEKDLFARVEKGQAGGDRLRLRAAGRLNALGEIDRAAKILDSLAPRSEEDRLRVALERLFVAAAQGDGAKVSLLFSKEAALRRAMGEKIAFVRAIEARLKTLPDAVRGKWKEDSAGALVEKGIRENPGEPAFRIAKAALLQTQKKAVAAAAELLEIAPGDPDLIDLAMEELDPSQKPVQILIGGAPNPPPAPEEPESRPRLIAALENLPKGDPRIDYQCGHALTAMDKREEALLKYQAALDSCRSQPAGKPFHGAAVRVAFQLASEKGPEGWREKCVEVILAISKNSPAIPYEFLFDEVHNPVALVIADSFLKKDWLKGYRTAVASLHLWTQRHETLTEEGVQAIKKEVYKEQAPEKYVELAEFFQGFGKIQEVADALEKAAEKAPRDLEILERLARKHAELGHAIKAEAAFQKLLPQVAPHRRPELLLDLAQMFLNQKDQAKAKEALGNIDPHAMDAATAIRCVELRMQAQDWDRAIEACRRAFELGQRPHFLMGRCLEKKEDYYEALRYYNRDAAEGSSGGESQTQILMRQMARGNQGQAAEPADGRDARERLLRKLGPDWLLKRFLSQEFDRLGAEDERKVKASLERLSSDEVADRDAGLEDLRALGARAAPHLAPLLNSGDDEVKTRIRQLLCEWAEPK